MHSGVRRASKSTALSEASLGRASNGPVDDAGRTAPSSLRDPCERTAN